MVGGVTARIVPLTLLQRLALLYLTLHALLTRTRCTDSSCLQIKNRHDKATSGGWRDLMLSVLYKGYIFEVQIAHKLLIQCRKGTLHATFCLVADARCCF